MKIKIYFSCNRGLPNLKKSLSHISEKLRNSDIPKDNLQFIDSNRHESNNLNEAGEYPALNKLWLDSHTDNFYALYLHCKGASKTNETELLNSLAWADYMLYGLLDNYKLCLEHMNNGADLVGSMWYRHFKGNFFWIRSDYARKLHGPYELNTSNRLSAEYWCSQSYWQYPNTPLPKVKNLYYLPIKTDNDFLNLSLIKYIPSFTNKNKCIDLKAVINSKNYSVYDQLELRKEDFDENHNQIHKYINYDSIITFK